MKSTLKKKRKKIEFLELKRKARCLNSMKTRQETEQNFLAVKKLKLHNNNKLMFPILANNYRRRQALAR